MLNMMEILRTIRIFAEISKLFDIDIALLLKDIIDPKHLKILTIGKEMLL